jgi:hypothetical protein
MLCKVGAQISLSCYSRLVFRRHICLEVRLKGGILNRQVFWATYTANNRCTQCLALDEFTSIERSESTITRFINFGFRF